MCKCVNGILRKIVSPYSLEVGEAIMLTHKKSDLGRNSLVDLNSLLNFNDFEGAHSDSFK